MRIAINAISVKQGGSAVVLEKLLEQFLRLRPDCEYLLIANTRLAESAPMRHSSVRAYRFPWAERGAPATLFWYAVALPLWLARERVDVLFSQTNYLPPWAPARTVLLEQHAGYFCPDFHLEGGPPLPRRLAWEVKKAWVLHSLRAADRVTVQTRALADRIADRLPAVAGRLRVIPHGPGYLDRPAPATPAAPRPGATFEIAYVSGYGVQKNFAVVLRALGGLRARGIPCRLNLTLDPRDPGAARIAALARALGVERETRNHGASSREALSGLYRAAHVFVFPSVCESFGFPLAEALAFGLPVLAADTPGNRELAADAATYFPPRSERCLAGRLEELYRDPSRLLAAARASARRAAVFDWERAGRETLAWVLGEPRPDGGPAPGRGGEDSTHAEGPLNVEEPNRGAWRAPLASGESRVHEVEGPVRLEQPSR